jgi:undecaprenyl diphosphate synthase
VISAPAPKGAKGLEEGRTVPRPVARHVAIIMDGNGRWARARGLPRVAGHKAGAEAVRRAMQSAVDHGVEVLTLYAFSSENWRRSPEEITDLTALMRFYLERELATLDKEGVRLRLIGDYSAFGPDLVARLEQAVAHTADNDRLTLVVALNYGSRAEIAAAARTLATKAAAGEIDAAGIDEDMLAGQLQTHGLPQLDLLIRTSGEVRLSNFLLWQAAYAELMFVDILWPDFDEQAFAGALAGFADRERRYGGR